VRYFILVLFLAPATFGVAEAAERNVMLIVADDLGSDLGCYGRKRVESPNIDKFAAAGTRFTQSYCTTSSCSASRSVILTGLHNHANGQFGHAHAPSDFHTHSWVQGLPALLHKKNYQTLCLGKFHVQPASVYGFDQFAAEGKQGRSPEAFAVAARSFIDQSGDRPFFIYACSNDPHRNFANDVVHDGEKPVVYKPAEVEVPAYLPDSPQCRQELCEYLRAVSRFDQLAGKLLGVLDATGHADDTLVIVMSDNGAPFPGAKTTLYEPGARLPLIIRAPGASPAVSGRLVSWVDITPTILDYARAPGPDYPLHGRSLLPDLGHAVSEAEGQEIFYSHTFHAVTEYYPMRGIRRGKLKFIHNLAYPLPFPGASDLVGSSTWQAAQDSKSQLYGRRAIETYLHRPEYELYDLEADPDELHNLADDPRYAEKVRSLRQRVQQWQKQTQDPWQDKTSNE
jgi:N-sulfoglucosamine sulfohydrolase